MTRRLALTARDHLDAVRRCLVDASRMAPEFAAQLRQPGPYSLNVVLGQVTSLTPVAVMIRRARDFELAKAPDHPIRDLARTEFGMAQDFTAVALDVLEQVETILATLRAQLPSVEQNGRKYVLSVYWQGSASAPTGFGVITLTGDNPKAVALASALDLVTVPDWIAEEI